MSFHLSCLLLASLPRAAAGERHERTREQSLKSNDKSRPHGVACGRLRLALREADDQLAASVRAPWRASCSLAEVIAASLHCSQAAIDLRSRMSGRSQTALTPASRRSPSACGAGRRWQGRDRRSGWRPGCPAPRRGRRRSTKGPRRRPKRWQACSWCNSFVRRLWGDEYRTRSTSSQRFAARELNLSDFVWPRIASRRPMNASVSSGLRRGSTPSEPHCALRHGIQFCYASCARINLAARRATRSRRRAGALRTA